MLSSRVWEMPTQGAPFSREVISGVLALLQLQPPVPRTPAIHWLS